MTKKRQTLEEKKASLLEAHKKKIDQINNQIKAKEAREKEKERKTDTRRKIIIGGLSRNHMDKNRSSEFAKTLERLMNEYIVKDNDRDLFGLPHIPELEQTERLKRHAEERKKQSDLENMNNKENR